MDGGKPLNDDFDVVDIYWQVAGDIADDICLAVHPNHVKVCQSSSQGPTFWMNTLLLFSKKNYALYIRNQTTVPEAE